MVREISPIDLKAIMDSGSSFALIDVRESGEYNSSHIPGSSSLPRRQLELQMTTLVPFKGVQVIVCDDDGRRAKLAAATLERIGYTQVSMLEGGINRWSTMDYPTEWGSNVPSKDYGEKMEVVHHVPEIDALDLHTRMERGDNLVILDTRTPEEYQRFCIPGGRSLPGGELALRITDVVNDIDEYTTVIINCAGRTRSIIGTRVLQRMGIANIYGLKNGTSGWVLAGYPLEAGADRLDLPEPSQVGRAAGEEYAARLATEDGVSYLTVQELQHLMGRADSETVYLIDVRTEKEYIDGHIPGFRWVPGGQCVQRTDDVAAVRDGSIVFACDGKVRATVTASWYRQMGFPNVFVLDGGTAAWVAAGFALGKGVPEQVTVGLAEAREKVRLCSPQELNSDRTSTIIFVDTSREFASGHVPGSHWVPRGWLEFRIEAVAPAKDASIVVTDTDGLNAILAGATLMDIGYSKVSVLDGGMAAWRQAGIPAETGLTGVIDSPDDVVLSGPDRSYADMMNYLRWEEELGKKYETTTKE